MDVDTDSAESSSEPHLMRVATHGKLKVIIAYAIKFLKVSASVVSSVVIELTLGLCKENEHRPLVFHTLSPPAKSVDSAEGQSLNLYQ